MVAPAVSFQGIYVELQDRLSGSSNGVFGVRQDNGVVVRICSDRVAKGFEAMKSPAELSSVRSDRFSGHWHGRISLL